MAIAIINDFDGKLFELNGIKYVRNFQAIKIGDRVRISSAYDSRFTLVVAHYSDYVVNGGIFNNSDTLVSTLSAILFVKDELLMSSPGEASNTTIIQFSNIYGGFINSPSVPIVTDTITFDLTNAKNGGVIEAYYSGNILTKDSFLGGTIVSFSNPAQALNQLCFIWISYDKGNNAFFVNIRADWTGEIPLVSRPSTMGIVEVTDETLPGTMLITNITDET